MVAPGSFGPVERDVGVTQEILGRWTVPHRNPDARRDRDRHAVDPRDVEGGLEHLVHPFGDHLGPVGERDALRQNHELVPTETADRVA